MAFGAASRIVGIDDGPFRKTPRARVLVVGVLMRGGTRVEGVMSTHVTRDGVRATDAIAEMLSSGRLAGQAQAVLLDGVAVGGFNVIDLPALAEALRVPVVAVMRRKPDMVAVRQALLRTHRAAWRWSVIERAGTIHAGPGLYFQVAGAESALARQILAASTIQGTYPEPLRLAHLIARGVLLGASRGGA